MPCNSDHMQASCFEIEMSRVMALLKELRTARPPLPKEWEGYGDAYCKSISKEEADKLVAELCAKIQEVDVTTFSLEMQIWWRDHQEADRRRIAQEEEATRQEQLRRTALEKLTPEERRALGK